MESEWVCAISYLHRGPESKWDNAILYNLPPQVGSTSNLNNSGSRHATDDLLTVLEYPMYTAYIWWTVQFDEKLPLWAFDELPFWWIGASMKRHRTKSFYIKVGCLQYLHLYNFATVIHIMTVTTIFIKFYQNSSNNQLKFIQFMKNQFLMISDYFWEMFDDYLMSL